MTAIAGPSQGGELTHKNDGGCSSYVSGVKKRIWYHLGCSASNGPEGGGGGAFAVPFRVLSRIKYDRRLYV